jgi:general secretion pathway protein D
MVAASAQAAPQQVTAAGARPGGASASLVQADEATNSIIINASDTVYNNLRTVIEQLDIRRSQVYVEALIAEMNADRTDELGFQWAAANGVGSNTVGAFANFPGANPSIAAAATAPAAAAAASAGLTVAVLGGTITLPDGTQIRGLGALARALTSKDLGNVLSTPNLLTLDNYQAKIVVGQNVPFITGSFATPSAVAGTTTGAVNPFQTIERKDVGLTLRIKPQISEGSTIRLEIYQEVSDVAQRTLNGASDLVTNKRALETKVVVDDGNTIVLGGLIQNTVNVTTQGIPLLSDIPFLGALFRFKSEERKRTNLMVFLRPVIIRSVEDSYRVTTDRYEYLRGYMRGEGPEREEIYDRMAPVRPSPEPARRPEPAAPASPPEAPPNPSPSRP